VQPPEVRVTIWLGLRLVKFASVVVFAASLGGALAADRAEVRARWARVGVPVGLVASWAAGWALLRVGGGSPAEPWVPSSMALSLVAVEGALRAHRGSGRVGGALIGGGLAATIGAMVLRSLDAGLAGAVGFGAVGAAVGAMIASPATGSVDVGRGFFLWVARLEGASFVVLLANTAAKRLAHVELDGGTGTLGFVHGALFFLFVRALLELGAAERWSSVRQGAAFGASLLPFGTFAFEAWLSSRPPAPTSGT
jgi:integral membrane protein